MKALQHSVIFLLLLSLLISTSVFAAEQAGNITRVSLLLGDGASATALRAVETLRNDPNLQGVEFRVFPRLSPSLEARRFLQFSNIVLVNTHDREFVFDVAEDLQAAQQRGSSVLSVSDVFDPEVAAVGITQDRRLMAYFERGGHDNLMNMVRAALAARSLPSLAVGDVLEVPETAYYEFASKEFFTSFSEYEGEYLRQHPGSDSRPWVGLFINRDSAVSDNDAVVAAVAKALEARGMNVLAGFGYPGHSAVPVLFLDEQSNSRVKALIAFSLKLGNLPDELAPVLSKLDAPIINAITLYNYDAEEWAKSTVGLELSERAWQIGNAELAGAIAPTVVGTKELVKDPASNVEFVRAMPIAERVERLADRALNYVRLRELPAADKKVAVIYYNYPPGRENIGASYLNVMAQSLWQIADRMRSDGYTMPGLPSSEQALFDDIRNFGNNPPPDSNTQAVVDRLARSGQAQLWPVSAYRRWFDAVPATLRDAIVKRWGEPEQSEFMTWRNDAGEPFFVFPARRWGSVVYAPQPVRAGDQAIEASYHDLSLPPPHNYLAFYLWLQHEFKADAMVHVGTHATHEWLPGREAGFTDADPSEVMVGAVPQLYPYIVDNIGEGQQAKRRGMATIITHMTPPLDRATMNPEMRAIAALISDFTLARQKGAVADREMVKEITEQSTKIGLLTDLSIQLQPGELLSDAEVDEVEHHIKHIGEHFAPFGLHTFGVAPDPTMQEKTAEAILSLEPELTHEQFATRKASLVATIQQAARNELDALSDGLAGHYIDAGPGNDPLRNPDSLPTGKNFYGFDPSRLPTTATYAAGKALADDMLNGYQQRHNGQYPDRLVFNLFATETNRHEGSIEAEILNLMGVRPIWDLRGRVQGIELISREELGRPRVDVTVVPSGLYRDLFPALMVLLDQAVDVVKNAEREGNPLRMNVERRQAEFEAQGIKADVARRLASVRLFTEPTGTYGTGLETVINADQSWEEEQEVADVYFRRVGHLFGQGFWGDVDSEGTTSPQLAESVFKAALSGAKAVIHSRSSAIYATLDNDDFYQYLGGTAMAVRQIDGSTPETLVADLSHPGAGDTISLERFMGEELRARYLNPKWIEAMLDEGYAGARFIRQVVDNLWGWQVTTPEAIDAAKWQEMFETYVEDRYELDVEQRFRSAENLGAYQALMERMLVAVDKGYWDAPAETIEVLKETLERIIPEVLADEARIAALMTAAPAVTAAPTPAATSSSPAAAPTASAAAPAASAAAAAATSAVEGRVLEEQARNQQQSGSGDPWQQLLQMLGYAFLVAALFATGWWRQGRTNS